MSKVRVPLSLALVLLMGWIPGFVTTAPLVNAQPSAPEIPAYAIAWVKDYARNPLDIAGDANLPVVLYEENIYKMWYYDGWKILYTTSLDAIAWSTPQVVLDGVNGTWEEIVASPDVINDQGLYRMWYGGMSPSEGRVRLGYAESLDGITWVNRTPVVLPWTPHSVSGFEVTKDGTTLKMWYSAETGYMGPDDVYYAESSDGINWQGTETPVISPSGPYSHFYVGALSEDNSRYLLYINAETAAHLEPIVTASDDGVNWSATAEILGLRPEAGQWDSHEVRAYSVVTGASGRLLFYAGGGGVPWLKIGLAVPPSLDTMITSVLDGDGASVPDSGSTLSTSVTFELDGTDNGVAGFECSLDSSPFAACASPTAHSDLGYGGHRFEVRAVDSSGNVDPTPASFTWTVMREAPYQFTTEWGSPGSADGQFSSPWGIAVDSSGNVYVADTGNNRIQKFTSDGEFITTWGSTGSEYSQPYGIAVDTSGFVYVNFYPCNIQKFTSDGEFVTSWGSCGNGEGQFGQYLPLGIGVDSSGYVYVSDPTYSRVQKFSGQGDFITMWNTPGGAQGQGAYPFFIAVDSTGNVYAVCTGDDPSLHHIAIQKFTSDGALVAEWVLASGTSGGQFNVPAGIDVDSLGNMYVSDMNNNRIQKLTSDGVFVTMWGSSGAGDGQFNGPIDVAVDSAGRAYVLDAQNSRVQVFSPTVTDGTPPDTSVVSAADGDGAPVSGRGTTLSNSITFEFSGTDNVAVAGFECDLDGGAFTVCASPMAYGDLASGGHVFQVRAVDSSGNVDPSPVNFTWTVVANAEAVNMEWSRTYGGATQSYAYSVIQTSDGGYAIAGETRSPANQRVAWLLKTDSSGNMEWSRTYEEDVAAYSVIQTSDGGYALAVGDHSFWLLKTDSSGNIQWSRRYAGEFAYSVVQTSDGGYALAGEADCPNDLCALLVKTDSSGNVQWSQTYEGARSDEAYSVIQTADGGYAIAGGYGNSWLLKTDSSGNMQWSRTYAGGFCVYSVVQTSDGGYAIAGTRRDGTVNSAWVVKTDLNGYMQGSRTYGGPGGGAVAYSLVQTSDGGYAIAGFGVAGYGDAWVAKTDSSGNMKWSQAYGGPDGDVAYSLVQTGDGGYAIAGWTEYVTEGGGNGAWLIKLPRAPVPDGAYQFVTKWGSLGSGDGQFNSTAGIAVDSTGNVYVTDLYNHRIQKFTPDGAFVTKWGSEGSGNGQFEYPFGVATDASGYVYISDTTCRVQKFTSDGIYVSSWGSCGEGEGQLGPLTFIAIGPSGDVYVTDAPNGRVQKFNSEGVFERMWGSKGSGPGQFCPYIWAQIAVDSENVYVSDCYHRIQKFTPDGAFVTMWGSSGSAPGQFNAPQGIGVDSSGNVYVADGGNNRIQKFTSDGAFITMWGTPGAGDGQFGQPFGVAVDSSGRVYVTDGLNARVQVFGPVVVDLVPPETAVDSAVDGNGAPVSDGESTLSGSITFEFSGTDNVAVAGFECNLDGGAFAACASPISFSDLSTGDHTFQTRAVDTSGNVDPPNTKTASFTWTISVNASPTGTWVRTYGGAGFEASNDIEVTSDGGAILVARTTSYGAGGYDAWVLKLDSDGNTVWQKAYGGPQDDFLYDACTTSDGGYVLAGLTYSYGSGDSDAWVVKLDSQGDIVWQKVYGGAGADDIVSVVQSSDGGFFALGDTQSAGAGGWDQWVLKLDANGDVLWQKTYGGNGDDFAGSWNSMSLTADGGVIIVGETSSVGAGGDLSVLKIDNNGEVQWQKALGRGYSVEEEDIGDSVRQTYDGGYVVVGTTNSFGSGNSDGWILKLDSQGNIIWAKTYGGSNADEMGPVEQTSDGGYYVVGRTVSYGAGDWDIWVLKLDGDGNAVWQKVYGGTGIDRSNQFKQTPDGRLIIAGRTESFGGASSANSQLLILKVGPSGETCVPSEQITGNSYDSGEPAEEATPFEGVDSHAVVTSSGAAVTATSDVGTAICEVASAQLAWAKTYGGSGAESTQHMIATVDGGYLELGATDSFGAGATDAWALKLDATGDVIWQKTYGGQQDDYLYWVTEVKEGGYILAGSTNSFGAGNSDVWVVRTDVNGNVLWQKTYGGLGVDEASSVVETGDGGFMVVADTNSFGAGGFDAWLLRLDANGNVSWQKTYGSTGDEHFYQLVFTDDGKMIALGDTDSFGSGGIDIWLLKLTSDGNVDWQRTYGGPNEDSSISLVETSDGGYVVTGYTYSFGHGKADAWILRLDSSGDIVWQKTYGGPDVDLLIYIQPTTDGGYVVAGRTKSFGYGDWNAWVVRLSSDGNAEWQWAYGTSAVDRSAVAIQSPDGGFVVAGRTESFGPSSDLLILKLSPLGEACLPMIHVTTTPIDTTAAVAPTTVSGLDSAVSAVAGEGTVTDTSAQVSGICGIQPVTLRFTKTGGDLLVTDPQGRRVGSDTVSVFSEIPGATYTGPGTDPEVITIPNPLPGQYQVQITGRATAQFAVTGQVTVGGETIQEQTLTGQITPGEVVQAATTYQPEVPTESLTPIELADTTAPTTTLSLSGNEGNSGWYKSNVQVTLTAVDNEGGSGVQEIRYRFGGTDWTVYTSPLTISAEGTTTIYFSSADRAGNVEPTKTESVRIDKTAPTINIASPVSNNNYTLHGAVASGYDCSDASSGVASCSGPVSSGSMFDTTTVGAHTFTVTATDVAGNTASETVKYGVVYLYGGVLQPINTDGSSIFKLGSTVPVKFQLKDANGNYVSIATARIYVAKISNGITGTDMEAVSTSAATTGNLFRYDVSSHQYIFNWGTKGLSAGTWQIKIALDDGTTYTIKVSLKA